MKSRRFLIITVLVTLSLLLFSGFNFFYPSYVYYPFYSLNDYYMSGDKWLMIYGNGSGDVIENNEELDYIIGNWDFEIKNHGYHLTRIDYVFEILDEEDRQILYDEGCVFLYPEWIGVFNWDIYDEAFEESSPGRVKWTITASCYPGDPPDNCVDVRIYGGGCFIEALYYDEDHEF